MGKEKSPCVRKLVRNPRAHFFAFMSPTDILLSLMSLAEPHGERRPFQNQTFF